MANTGLSPALGQTHPPEASGATESETDTTGAEPVVTQVASAHDAAVRVPRRTMTRAKRDREAATEGSGLVRDHPKITVYAPHAVFRELEIIQGSQRCPMNTLVLRGLAMVLDHYKRPTFRDLAGEDPWAW